MLKVVAVKFFRVSALAVEPEASVALELVVSVDKYAPPIIVFSLPFALIKTMSLPLPFLTVRIFESIVKVASEPSIDDLEIAPLIEILSSDA